jgi:uncharacterized protein (UPF0548 family)
MGTVNMFLIRRPSDSAIHAFVEAERTKPFSYSPTGLTLEPPKFGLNIDHNRIQLGSGAGCYSRAIAAIKNWKMFDLGWVYLCWPNAPIHIGSTVAIVVKHLGFWSLNACRIVYVVEDVDETKKRSTFGFAYGTLPGHAEVGEERFTVELNHDDDSVWYDIVAVSRPGSLARLGYPYSRRLQKRFACDSKAAMQRAVSAT